jgi:hypothetical protein
MKLSKALFLGLSLLISAGASYAQPDFSGVIAAVRADPANSDALIEAAAAQNPAEASALVSQLCAALPEGRLLAASLAAIRGAPAKAGEIVAALLSCKPQMASAAVNQAIRLVDTDAAASKAGKSREDLVRDVILAALDAAPNRQEEIVAAVPPAHSAVMSTILPPAARGVIPRGLQGKSPLPFPFQPIDPGVVSPSS